MGSGHLEVHVSEEVLKSLDIRQHDIIVVRLSRHKAAGNACHLLLNRNARRHQGHGGRTDGRLRGGAVGFKGLGYGTDRVREFILGRKNRHQGLFCQRAVADLTSSRSSGGLGLSNGIGREL